MFYRSQLFVPGNRPDRFEKACASDADLVCIDLEDAVGPAEKDYARDQTLQFLKTASHNHVSLRINPADTSAGQKDITALASSGLTLPFVMIPKVSSHTSLAELDQALPQALGPFFGIIESAIGLVNADSIFSHARLKFGMYGAIDYAGDVDCDLSWETHLYARTRLVSVANAFEVILFDTPHTAVRDLDDCEATTRKVKNLGIHARSAIHPAQIARIHTALAPTQAEQDWAKRVIEAYNKANGNVVLLDGAFIEAPVVKRAQRMLAFKI